jgi:hypothetical protein
VTVRLLQLNLPERVEERELLLRLGSLPAAGSEASEAP